MVLNKYKIMLIGDSSVGKTSAIFRYCEKQYLKLETTVGCDIKVKKINLDDENIHLEIWDTAGQEQYGAISVSVSTYRNIKGIILMYDITRLHTFKMLEKWNKVIDENVSRDVVKILVGNKCDVPDGEREVDFETGSKYAKKLNIPFFEVSSKEDINITKAFVTLARDIRKQTKQEDEPEECIKVNKDDKKSQDSGGSLCSCTNINLFFSWK